MPGSEADNIDEYISEFPQHTQEILKEVRATIRKAIPNAEEKISYAIPTFMLDGQYIIYFAGYKNHISLYPAPRGHDAFKEELSRYKGGKGTVQFPLDEPIPFKLITKIVKFKLKEGKERAVQKKIKKSAGSKS